MKRHICLEWDGTGRRATLCGEGTVVDNVAPDCEPCQIVSEFQGGDSIEEIARSHAMPGSLVEDVLRSCARRRRWRS